jgi:hypothetical protein
MTETITIRKCDICGKEMNKWEHGFLKYRFTVKDYLGNGCATGGNIYNDVCDTCGLLIDDAVNEIIKTKKEKK